MNKRYNYIEFCEIKCKQEENTMKIKREIKKVEEEIVSGVYRCHKPGCGTPCYIIRTANKIYQKSPDPDQLACVYRVGIGQQWEEIPLSELSFVK